MRVTKKYLDDLTYKIVGGAIEVHKVLGPGLLESVYEECLKYELEKLGLKVERQLPVNIHYKELIINTKFRLDLLVEDIHIVELKAVTEVTSIDKAQILSHMKLLKKPKGILINFNCGNIFREGQETFVNEHYRNLPST